YTFINKKFISTNVGKSQLADTTVPILLPACLGLVLFVSTEYVDYTKLWMPVSFFTAIILFLFYKSGIPLFDKKKNPPILLKVFLVATAIGLTAGVSYTYITILNTYFDRSKVVWHQSKIIEKTKTTGKTSSWYIKVEKWGTFDEPKKHKISREKWNHLTEGDLVQIGVSSGFLGFPWVSHIEKNQ
ncbi:MAG: hypothetical protein M9962_07910, partial [Oligoflexia bacterium]|nr:hypothetical protein [Oligoflexia bacterium]